MASPVGPLGPSRNVLSALAERIAGVNEKTARGFLNPASGGCGQARYNHHPGINQVPAANIR
jgi:hypothetical protein